MIFVSLPYSHRYKEVVDERVKLAALYSEHLLQQGKIPMSPILFGSKVLEHVNMPGDFATWDILSLEYLNACDEIHVLCINGWDKSIGVMGEMNYAKQKKKKIKFISISNPQLGVYYFKEGKK